MKLLASIPNPNPKNLTISLKSHLTLTPTPPTASYQMFISRPHLPHLQSSHGLLLTTPYTGTCMSLLSSWLTLPFDSGTCTSLVVEFELVRSTYKQCSPTSKTFVTWQELAPQKVHALTNILKTIPIKHCICIGFEKSIKQ